ncbi:MAG: helix-turn-helix domain-containing protein [Firmicutes bacterium]|nr:helix-turn-helix domain-containing protein [Bacillota bacterium]
MYSHCEFLDSDLSYERLVRTEKHAMSSVHHHNSFEIYYLQEGERGYDIEDKTFNVRKGDIILINKYKPHKTFYTGKDHFKRMLLKFKESSLGDFSGKKDDDLLECFNKGINILRLDAQNQIMIENIFAQMNKEQAKIRYGHNIYLKILLIELLIFINRIIKGKWSELEETRYHVKIVEIMNYIDNNYYRDLKLSKLSDKFAYSSNYLSSLFKKITGSTLTQYINNVRIREAQNLLLYTDLNITQISEKVGYNNLIHFERTFKKLIELSPSNYRKCFKSK